MGNNLDSILIKTKDGQMKTVDLGTTKPIQPSPPISKQNNLDGLNKKKIIIPKDEPVVKTEPPKPLPKVEPVPRPRDKEKIPEPIAPETTMPAFYFDLEDEQEVAKFRDNEQFNQQKRHQATLEDLNSQVIKQSNLELPDNVISRLKRVIDSRFREIRDLRETKDVLMRSRDLGGAGLDNNQAQDILKLIEKQRLKIGEEDIKTLKHENIKTEKEKRMNHVKELEKAKESLLKQVKPISTYVHPSYKKEPITTKIPGRVIPTSQEIVKPKIKPSPPAYIKKEFKKPSKVMGPIEELSSFDLESFRALGSDIHQVIEKIIHKISLLEDESFEKKAQGIQSWHASQVYQNYLSLGQESMAQGKPVQEIIKEKQSQNMPTLNFEEFEAIADLNEELAY